MLFKLVLSFITYHYFRCCFPTYSPCFGYSEGSYPGPIGSAPAPEVKCKYDHLVTICKTSKLHTGHIAAGFYDSIE
jgi:hypothetical protein